MIVHIWYGKKQDKREKSRLKKRLQQVAVWKSYISKASNTPLHTIDLFQQFKSSYWWYKYKSILRTVISWGRNLMPLGEMCTIIRQKNHGINKPRGREKNRLILYSCGQVISNNKHQFIILCQKLQGRFLNKCKNSSWKSHRVIGGWHRCLSKIDISIKSKECDFKLNGLIILCPKFWREMPFFIPWYLSLLA